MYDQPVTADADQTLPITPVRRPARPIAPAPSRTPTEPAGMTITPGELQQIMTTTAVEAVKVAKAEDRAKSAESDTEITIDLQKTVSRLKTGIAAVVAIAAVVMAVLNGYADQRVAAAAEDQRRLDVAEALGTISTQHALDQTTNEQTHRRQAAADKRRDVLQVEQGKDTRRLLMEVVPAGRRGSVETPAPSLTAAEGAVLGVATSGVVPPP